MNKKFSTLLCASLLFSSAFSAVNAGNIRGYAQGSDAAAILKLDKMGLAAKMVSMLFNKRLQLQISKVLYGV